MKKLIALALCLVFLCSAVLPASAATYSTHYYHELYSGQCIYLDNEDFENSSGDEPTDDLTNANFTVTRSFTYGKSYIEGIYFDDSLEKVVVVTDPNEKPDSDGQPLVGKITITERGTSKRYVCEFRLVTDKEDLTKTYDYMIFHRDNSSIDEMNKKYWLPEDYQEATTTFKNRTGTLVAEFDYYATFTVDIRTQSALYLGYHNYIHPSLWRKIDNEDDSISFGYISWYGNPVFDNAGTLEIEADGLEYLYLVTDNTTVQFIKGSYDEDKDVHIVKTNKLGQYLLTDEKLNFSSGTLTSTFAAAAASSSSSSAAPSSSSSSPKPSSSVAPSSSSSVAPSSSSSSAVPSSSSSSVAPSSSASEEPSSVTEESSSAAPSSSSSSPKPSSSSATQTVTPVEDEDKGLPVSTIIIAAMAAIIVLLLVLLFVGPRKKRGGFDDWDD